MFKKLNTKTLLVIFGVLLAVIILVQIIQRSKGDKNFDADIVKVDTAKVSAIYIKLRGAKEEYKLVKNGKDWLIINKGVTHKTEKGSVETVLTSLTNLRADRIAATDKAAWPEYEVTDSTTRVRVEQDGKVVADFYLGKFTFQQYSQSTYIRVVGDDNVYAVGGVPGMTIGRDANDFRDKVMVRLSNVTDINKVSFNYPDSSFNLVKENNTWKINGEKADSVKVANYLSSISGLYGTDFVDDAVVSGNQVFSVKIEGKNFQPIELKAAVADSVNKYVVTSNQNEGRFSGTKGDLAARVFKGLNSFKPDSEKLNKKK